MYKAIVIDDEHMIVKGLTKLIHWNKLGYELIGTASCGETALTLIQTLNPDVVISDIQLGDITGLELMEQAKAFNPHILPIFISGYDSFQYCQKALTQGAVDYILKPVNFEHLEAKLKKCIEIIREQKILQNVDRLSFIEEDSERNESADAKLINNIKTYIDEHYHENISIESISQVFFICPSYFSELFKKEFGVNFKKYLTRIRIEKAKLYLMKSNYSISDITFKIGYNDPGYFSQIFKKHTQMTPRQFKLNYVETESY